MSEVRNKLSGIGRAKNWIINFVRRETVMCTAAVCAAASMLAVPPSGEYVGYINYRVIGLLFCLMCVVAGFQECRLFKLLAYKLLSGCKNARVLVAVLVMLPFFASMLVTNDVALITFVPFTISVMKITGRDKLLPWVIVMQTLAANLGSMATPVGNPQNLFLYGYFELLPSEFFAAVIPVTVSAFVILLALSLTAASGKTAVQLAAKPAILGGGRLALYVALFALCIAAVFRALDWRIVTIAVVVCFLIFSRRLLLGVDYCLLLTFVFFFIFAGNLGQISAVNNALTALLDRSAIMTAAFASQFISNVPAAVLLAGFTEDWRGLLLGVDIGGLGTPVASLASLISMKLYFESVGSKPGKYIVMFLGANFVLLAVLLALTVYIL